LEVDLSRREEVLFFALCATIPLAMLDVIFAFKLVHVLAATVMLGTWFCLAAFMLLAHRSGNTSVVALTSQFVVRIELMVVAAAVALQPLSGFPLAWAIGLDPLGEFWIIVSLALYAAIVAAWIAAVRIEIRIRNLTRTAALEATPLRGDYRRLFRSWSLLAGPILAGMIAVVALMIWQPRLD
jgi:uncharacterized membrane protein